MRLVKFINFINLYYSYHFITLYRLSSQRIIVYLQLYEKNKNTGNKRSG